MMHKKVLFSIGAAALLALSASASADYVVVSENGYCAVFRSIPGNFETNFGEMRFTLNPNWLNATCTFDSGDTLDRAYVTHEVGCTTTLGIWPDETNYHGTGHATIDSDGVVSIVCKTSVRQ